MRSASLSLLLAGLLATHAHANHDLDVDQLLHLSLEQLMATEVSISTSTKQKLSKAPAVVTLITEEDIKATGTTNLMEILQSVPGIYIKTNLFGAKPLITMRGASGANVLLMVNGAPAKDLVWSPGIFWKGIPAQQIERIEIIRGPGSALFGSDASAGVINVITKTAGKMSHSEVGVRAGSFDTQTAWVQHATQWNGFDIALSAEAAHTDGDHPFIARDRLGNAGRARFGWDNRELHFSISKDNWRVLLDQTRHTDVDIGLAGSALLNPSTRASDSLTSAAWLYNNERIAADWGLSAEARYREIEYDSGNGYWNTATSLETMNVAERRINAELGASYHGFSNHALRFGGGVVRQDPYHVRDRFNGVPQMFAPEQSRSNRYLFAQDVWTFARDWELTAGARYDHYSDFGGTFNPRLALVWQTSERLTSKLMVGQAFRAPSYLELYSQTSANAPNPELKPERSRTMDMAFSYRATEDLRLGVNFYRFDRRDVIAPATVTPFQFINVDRFMARGTEFEAQWQATELLRLSGNLSRLRVDEESVLRDLAIPLQQAYLRLDWAFMPRWHWNLQANWFSRRDLPANDRRKELGAYALADTTVRFVADRHWEFSASIRNLLDVDAREISSTRLPDNLPLPGRNFFAELRYKF